MTQPSACDDDGDGVDSVSRYCASRSATNVRFSFFLQKRFPAMSVPILQVTSHQPKWKKDDDDGDDDVGPCS